jgi:hypothetical protein
MTKELGLDERFGELREIDGDEGVREVGREPPLLRQIRNEFRAPDRGGRRSLAGAGFAEKQRREVLHAAPQPAFVAAHVVREDVVPQRLAQAAHRFAFARERPFDEVEGTAQLEEKREVAHRSYLG